jgi:hypothetical protein
MTTAAQHGHDKDRGYNEHIGEISSLASRPQKPEEKSTTKTLGTTFASGKVACTTHDHDKEEDECHVRFKLEISPLSSILDKSKTTLINVFCRHSYPTANKCSNNDIDGIDLPPTKCRNNEKPANHQEALRAARDPGNEILDNGEGKNNSRASFINNITNMVKPPPKHITTGPKETAALLPGLAPPTFQTTGEPIKGRDRGRHRKENKIKQQMTQTTQPQGTYWTTHKGEVQQTVNTMKQPEYRNSMCHTGLALDHPATKTLQEYATYGCPAKMGKPWTKAEIWEAVKRGPHVLALSAKALEHLKQEACKKVAMGQATIVDWDTVKDKNPPPQMKVSPIAAIPHKSKVFRSILDLSFLLRLRDGTKLPAINDSMTKTAPSGAINQLGHLLQRVIHAFAEADKNNKIFMAKWDIKDGFWRLDAKTGDEWNFTYVLPQPPGEPVKIVVPSSF